MEVYTQLLKSKGALYLENTFLKNWDTMQKGISKKNRKENDVRIRGNKRKKL